MWHHLKRGWNFPLPSPSNSPIPSSPRLSWWGSTIPWLVMVNYHCSDLFLKVTELQQTPAGAPVPVTAPAQAATPVQASPQQVPSDSRRSMPPPASSPDNSNSRRTSVPSNLRSHPGPVIIVLHIFCVAKNHPSFRSFSCHFYSYQCWKNIDIFRGLHITINIFCNINAVTKILSCCVYAII